MLWENSKFKALAEMMPINRAVATEIYDHVDEGITPKNQLDDLKAGLAELTLMLKKMSAVDGNQAGSAEQAGTLIPSFRSIIRREQQAPGVEE